MTKVPGKNGYQQEKGLYFKKYRNYISKIIYSLLLFFIFMAFTYSKEMAENKAVKPLVAISISGLWESNIGWKYNIKQQGNKFSWTVINRNQKASGTINNKKDIEVSWTDNDSKGTSFGSILEIDPQGKATFIEWDNGVFFQRIKTGT